jgi:hypothetical protein
LIGMRGRVAGVVVLARNRSMGGGALGSMLLSMLGMPRLGSLLRIAMLGSGAIRGRGSVGRRLLGGIVAISRRSRRVVSAPIGTTTAAAGMAATRRAVGRVTAGSGGRRTRGGWRRRRRAVVV